jgi:hypothetical protein
MVFKKQECHALKNRSTGIPSGLFAIIDQMQSDIFGQTAGSNRAGRLPALFDQCPYKELSQTPLLGK